MFCKCGTIITVKKNSSEIKCARCNSKLTHLNIETIKMQKTLEKEEQIEINEVKGAKIKYQCPNCNAEEMMYNTAQLRSADEGQTVFYSCECGYKLTVQS
ncbi:DNA-directed RNA polymerase I subunit RPA12 [Vairimorpha necatrix]|uniref:DNA-directed RNA polymerase I subunit RPA12 n=1 Tax=Vairimorpha necatrix TaxID=6039 RepID=A0AAX4JDN1_9MICR